MTRRRFPALLALVSLIWGASFGLARLEAARAARPSSAQVLYLPSGKYLRVLSLGFPNVMADAIYLWSIQYYSNYDAADRFRYLEHIYANVIAELDPKYIDPYLIGAMIMTVEAGQYEMALRLLDKGIAANPDEWILAFDAGFICYDELKDYPRAAAYFDRAMKAPGEPGISARLRAEMFNKMGDRRTSLRYWSEVLQTAASDYVRNVSSMHVHDLTIEVDLMTLRDAIEGYRTAHQELPPRLEALVRSGLLASLPVDPSGAPYLYDRRTGEVRSQTRFKLRRQAGA